MEAVRLRFETWRRNRGASRRIPEDLWREAVELAGRHGVWRTARALRLNNNELKQRLVARTACDEGSTFVELSPPMMAGGGAECVVEFEDAKGTRVRVRLPGWVVPDLAALARAFRRSEP
jgi:hypothetical protein